MDLTAFLARLSPSLRRARVEEIRRDLLPSMQPWGAGWQAYAEEVGIPCPEGLVELGDAMEHAYIYIRVRNHHYEMLTPASSREHRQFLIEASGSFDPELITRAPMLPVFGQDGDLLLVAADGQIHEMIHDDPVSDEIVAPSLIALLESAASGAANPI